MATVSGVAAALDTVTVRVAVAVRPAESFTWRSACGCRWPPSWCFQANGVATVVAGAASIASV